MLETLVSYPKREQVKAGALNEVDDLAILQSFWPIRRLEITIWACFIQKAGPQNIVKWLAKKPSEILKFQSELPNLERLTTH